MAQPKWVDLIIWEAILNDNPAATGIVEIGTFKGGFSFYLAAQARARDIFFRTYDTVTPELPVPGFVKLDVFAHADDVGVHLERNNPLIFFCDAGNNGKELRTFSKYLTSQSLIMVHDWGTEFHEKDVPDSVEMVYRDFFAKYKSSTRAFRVIPP